MNSGTACRLDEIHLEWRELEHGLTNAGQEPTYNVHLHLQEVYEM